MMKYLRSNKGFTLVEVIVVALIVLVLSAVAIPMYMNYTRDARRSMAGNTASSIASFMGVQLQLGNSVTCNNTSCTGTAPTGNTGEFTGETSVAIPANFCITIVNGTVSACHARDCGVPATEWTAPVHHFGANNPAGITGSTSVGTGCAP